MCTLFWDTAIERERHRQRTKEREMERGMEIKGKLVWKKGGGRWHESIKAGD